MSKKRFVGTVSSNKMTKAITVEVDSIVVHPLYNKRYKTSKKYKAACTDSSAYPIGATVTIEECRPMSKTITFQVVA